MMFWKASPPGHLTYHKLWKSVVLCSAVRSGLVWFGVAWPGLAWPGLARLGIWIMQNWLIFWKMYGRFNILMLLDIGEGERSCPFLSQGLALPSQGLALLMIIKVVISSGLFSQIQLCQHFLTFETFWNFLLF